MPSRVTACWGSPVMSRPRKTIRPPLGAISPAMSRNSVVLPAPFGPMIDRSSPCFTTRLTRLTARRLPKLRVTSWVWSSGASAMVRRR